MGLLDTLKGKGDELKKAAENTAEKTSLNLQISKLEKEVGDLYFMIGKIYYAEHGHEPEEKLADLCEKSSELLSKMQIMKEGIQNLSSGIRSVCPKCGAPISKDAVFCTSCGASMEKLFQKASEEPKQTEEQTPPNNGEKQYCVNCGMILPANSQFCTVCGAKLD